MRKVSKIWHNEKLEITKYGLMAMRIYLLFGLILGLIMGILKYKLITII